MRCWGVLGGASTGADVGDPKPLSVFKAPEAPSINGLLLVGVSGVEPEEHSPAQSLQKWSKPASCVPASTSPQSSE